MKVANPIYDIVFKYMMEDERIARTILSALLKVEVLAVEVRPHEYSDDTHENLSVFRIDFGATIRDADGNNSNVDIVLKKIRFEEEAKQSWCHNRSEMLARYESFVQTSLQTIGKDLDIVTRLTKD